MDDASLVRGFEPLRNLLRDRKRVLDRDRAARDALGQIVALDEFHHERRNARALFESVDGGDVRVIQRGEGFGFAQKACEPIVVSGQRWRQDLDRHLTLQLGIGSPVHLPHPAFANLGGNLVGAEASAGAEGQVADYMGLEELRTGLVPVRAAV